MILQNKTNFTIVLDLGHGGLDPYGNYVSYPDKMYKFPNGNVAYEGVFNRQIGLKVGNFFKETKYNVEYTVHPLDYTNPTLKERTDFANQFGENNSIALSLHSNASLHHNASGFEIYTSRGETNADVLASYIGTSVKNGFPNIRFRSDFSDGDLDKESSFAWLKNTSAPAILFETLFFDYPSDFELLSSEVFQMAFAKQFVKGTLEYLKVIC